MINTAAVEKEALLLEHLPNVKYIARSIHNRLPSNNQMGDLVHAGVLGLMDAFDKFDSCRNVNFASYAKHRIRGAILDSLRELDWSPRNLRRKARLIEQTRSKLEKELGRQATEEEVAKELGLEVSKLQDITREIASLEIASSTAESNDADGKDVTSSVAAPEKESPFHQCLAGEMKGLLNKAIEELPEREKRVLMLYYFEELNMKVIAAALGVRESRVSQIHALALSRLRMRMQRVASCQ